MLPDWVLARAARRRGGAHLTLPASVLWIINKFLFLSRHRTIHFYEWGAFLARTSLFLSICHPEGQFEAWEWNPRHVRWAKRLIEILGARVKMIQDDVKKSVYGVLGSTSVTHLLIDIQKKDYNALLKVWLPNLTYLRPIIFWDDVWLDVCVDWDWLKSRGVCELWRVNRPSWPTDKTDSLTQWRSRMNRQPWIKDYFTNLGEFLIKASQFQFKAIWVELSFDDGLLILIPAASKDIVEGYFQTDLGWPVVQERIKFSCKFRRHKSSGLRSCYP